MNYLLGHWLMHGQGEGRNPYCQTQARLKRTAMTAPLTANISLLVSFAYHDNRTDARENLAYFLTVGLPAVPRSELVHGLVINGHECAVHLPVRSDLIVLRRRNVGYDYGAHMAMLREVHRLRGTCATKGASLSKCLPFTHYFFTNAGVRTSPFLHTFSLHIARLPLTFAGAWSFLALVLAGASPLE